MGILSPLGAKVGLGLSLPVLLLALGVLWGLYGAQGRRLEACRTQHAQFVADVKAQRELARISDAAHKAEVERNQEKERADHETEIQHVRADFASRVRDYAKAHPGSSRSASVPSTPDAPGNPTSTSETAVVPVADLVTCADNTAAAEGWLGWWSNVAKIDR